MTRRALAAFLLVLAAVFGARLAVAGDVPVRRRNASAEESESFALGATVVIVSLAGIVLLLVVLKKHASDSSRLRGRGTSRLFSRRHGRSMGGALADQDAIAGLGAAHLMGGTGGADTSSTGGTDAGSFGSTGGGDVPGGGFGGGDGGGGGASGSR